MNSLISIIVPVYNISTYLEKCIESIINQTYRNLQIILVNDGSKDDCGIICDTYSEKDTRIKVIHKSNGGLVSARKAGLRAATGEYVIYVDGDDWIEPDLCENMLKEMLDSQADLVDAGYYKDIGEDVILMQSKISCGRYNAEDIIPIMLCDDNFNECRLNVYLWTKMFKRELLEKIQYFVDETISVGEDAAVTYPYVLQCKKISIINYSGYHYVQHLNSMVHTKNANEWEKNITLIKGLREYFIKDVHSDLLLRELNQYAKLLLMIRNISYFDKEKEGIYLYPFGGIEKGTDVIIYGAGSVGQSVYQYLKDIKEIRIVNWLDREYLKYQQLGLKVNAPENVKDYVYDNIKIMVAINSRNVVESVSRWLVNNQVKEEAIMWLTDDFIKMDLLSVIIDEEI